MIENMVVNIKNQEQQEYLLSKTPFQKEYETNLRAFLEEYIKKLELPEKYVENSFDIYEYILTSVESTPYKDKFTVFYESLGIIKGAQYVSASLLLITLFKNGITMNQRDLANVLELHNKGSISNTFNSLLSYLKPHQNYSFIYRFIPVHTLSQEEFNVAIMENVKYFSNFLTDHGLIDRIETDFILFLVTRYSKKIHNNLDTLFLKHPKYIASTLCWTYLIYYKDYDISTDEFINIIHLTKDVRFIHDISLVEQIPYTDSRLLSKSKKDFIEKIFTFGLSRYKYKVIFYVVLYLRAIKRLILDSFSLKKFYNKISHYFETEFLHDIMGLFDEALENGFEINYMAGNGQIYYYFPQTMALSLIYYSSRSHDILQKLLNKEFFKTLIHRDCSLRFFKRSSRYITEKENRLYAFIKDKIGRYKGQVYSKDPFKKQLTTELKRFYHLETDFLLKLYNMTDLSPFEFGNELNIHGGKGVTSIFHIVENKSKFTEPQTFQNIKKFITKHLNSEDQKKSLLWLNNLRNLRYKDFKHGSITYSFKWIKDRYSTYINRSLYHFLFKLWKGNYPREIFTDPYNTRASNLKFHGTTGEPLKTTQIEHYFSNFLEIHDSNHYLCEYVRNVFNHYRINKIGKHPDHPPILNHILSEERRALAIEIPVWKEITSSGAPKFFIGHIDLLLIEDDTLVIADYKPDLRKIYKSLPQITLYAVFLRDRLRICNKNADIKINCVGFTKDQAIEWNPNIIFPRIIDFVKEENRIRKSNLLTANRKIKKDLLRELRNLQLN
ncbi:MAG: hypothetical protein ACFFG0_19280 [Candidatus Thorarchaeota archaeon]